MNFQPSSARQISFRNRGFSLVEMLATIAILGILVAIAIMNFALVNDSVRETRDKRNAQEIAAICNAAQAAGLEFVSANDIEQTIRNVVTGGSPSDGAFVGKTFAMKHLDDADISGAKHFLSLDGGLVRYSKTRLD